MIANDQKFFRKEGYKDATIQIAKQMLKDNIPIENIIKYTGLSQKEVENLMK